MGLHISWNFFFKCILVYYIKRQTLQSKYDTIIECIIKRSIVKIQLRKYQMIEDDIYR